MVERVPSGTAVDLEGSTPSLGTKKCRNGETVDASFSSFNIFRINYPNNNRLKLDSIITVGSIPTLDHS